MLAENSRGPPPDSGLRCALWSGRERFLTEMRWCFMNAIYAIVLGQCEYEASDIPPLEEECVASLCQAPLRNPLRVYARGDIRLGECRESAAVAGMRIDHVSERLDRFPLAPGSPSASFTGGPLQHALAESLEPPSVSIYP
jgi:hypothetical protein